MILVASRARCTEKLEQGNSAIAKYWVGGWGFRQDTSVAAYAFALLCFICLFILNRVLRLT